MRVRTKTTVRIRRVRVKVRLNSYDANWKLASSLNKEVPDAAPRSKT